MLPCVSTFEGSALPDEEAIELWIVDGRISREPVGGADTIFDGGWILPGLVDAHCHVGLGPQGASISTRRSRRPRRSARSARCCCATADRRSTPAASTTVTICRESSAPDGIWPDPSVTSPGLPIDIEDESQLPDSVAEQARRGDGWVKLVGDWIDRGQGDLAPLWSDEALKGGDRGCPRARRTRHRACLR